MCVYIYRYNQYFDGVVYMCIYDVYVLYYDLRALLITF